VKRKTRILYSTEKQMMKCSQRQGIDNNIFSLSWYFFLTPKTFRIY